ncbi:MAG: hypothetical protein KBT04_05870 [Bacteroidales bacterium]|nr:hypothetical protein [Candidatus Colimorpha onthohippi]
MQSCTPQALRGRLVSVRTPAEALALGEPSMGALVRAEGGDAKRIKAIVKLQCVYMNDMLNLPRGLSEAMIERIAETAVTRYRWLTIPDVQLIFERAISGQWNGGNYYSTVNVPMVESWFARYADERMDAAEARSIEEAAQHKEWYERGSEADWRRRIERMMKK